MSFLYKMATGVARGWLRLCGTKCTGRENVPAAGVPCVIIGNHTSYGDAVVLACFYPHQICFLAKEELFEHKLFGALLKYLGGIPLKRNEADLKALKKSIKLIKDGNSLCVFAEGTRNKDGQMSEFKQGGTYLAYKTLSPIIPVAMKNTANFFRFWKRDIEIHIGEPIIFADTENISPELLEGYTNKVKDSINNYLV